MTSKKFTEAQTEAYYNSEDSLYRSFWDEEGSLHWGYFDNLEDSQTGDFLQACQRWNQYMLEASKINASAKVLDIGCGNGNTAIWLAEQTGCEVIGIDLSNVRINNAKEKAKNYPHLHISFLKTSATNLPFDNNLFTHVWSQATIYHIPERDKALQEIHRVLQEEGNFLFDDLITPIKEISPQGWQYVYERLLFEPTFNFDSYVDFLSQLGLLVWKRIDLSKHLKKSYELLSQLALEKYPNLSIAYTKMCEAIDKREIGWAFYHCIKVSDRLTWIYQNNDQETLRNKYNAWARIYDRELDQSYRSSPIESAQTLAQFLPQKDAAILDAGAGTGMVGEALYALGYTQIVGVDLSEEMLEIARKKQVYRYLYQGNLEEDINLFEPELFHAIISVGVFTFGHVHPQALKNLSFLLKSQGYFLLTVRADYYNINESLKQVLEELPWRLIARKEFNAFEIEPMYAFVWQKI
ncbi:methyltransferase domain-containing protein [Aetokthonos hydrillicola Thurmond2011]|jgi:ubiquinone/menaquinone biosynthesis C-methylase UbiE|uniref:Methyltransferase domain-containing protein n=1 Tax=Aetokthonos hydrillicola Thurmond2011 TaxID=2712845 RepID=A0AAP5I5P7_9CYAN|nr:methyltransferase domain-containing protein [Aetokthonos hydrillicola]MBO3460929.1 methyltransferase domain-containing protein [Aetokthonos hydrillicola CCALA 1050]MBW4586478.1 methyltransferase domain-containing protein [Aetokthonos hydrillicola CCALA 1050]MDR9893578.1 methyltransferase domain-containing protein [Aetokthonos hydrillicola Thurmond2011]